PIGLGRANWKTDSPRDVTRFQPERDCDRLRERPTSVSNQHGGLTTAVHVRILIGLDIAQHVHATQSIRLAQPLERRDEARGTSLRKSIQQNRFHAHSPHVSCLASRFAKTIARVNYEQICYQERV